MLVLSRRKGEALIINDNIIIYNLGNNEWGQCKLGIEAPPDVMVYREELYNRLNSKKTHEPGFKDSIKI